MNSQKSSTKKNSAQKSSQEQNSSKKQIKKAPTPATYEEESENSFENDEIEDINEQEISEEEGELNEENGEYNEDEEANENEDDEFEDHDDEDGMYPPLGPGVIYGPDPDPEDEIKADESSRLKIMGFGDQTAAPDLALINMKIDDLLRILAKFKDLRETTRTRQSYLDELADNLCTYYGYNRELIDLFMNIFNPAECVQFLEANEKPRPSTIRTNTLKTNRKHLAQILMQRGITLEPLAEWSKVGIKIFESKVPLGATPEYLAGHYMLQSASSFLPVIALAPQVGERVLDLASAPGGKTTYISQLMKNTGIVVANDAKLERLKALKFNLQRLGVTNCIVCNYDGRKFPKVMKGFDRVLLDAPCTGLGIISKDPSIKSQRQYIDIKKMSHLQKELIAAAIDCCKPGGYIVYSTCSITVEENEWVIDYALKNRFVKVVESGVEVGEEGIIKYQEKRFHPTVKLGRRIYPHTHNMDGFFICKLKKLQNGKRTAEDKLEQENDTPKPEEVPEKKATPNKKASPKVAKESETKTTKENSSIKKSKKQKGPSSDQIEEEQQPPVTKTSNKPQNNESGKRKNPAVIDQDIVENYPNSTKKLDDKIKIDENSSKKKKVKTK